MKLFTMLAAASFALMLFSCRKDFRPAETPNENAYFPVTEKEKERVAINKEVAKILEDVYQDPYAYYEVNAAIYSEYYRDETVLLKDLLFPETSPLYQTEKFKARKAHTGIFKTRFYEALNNGNFPIVKKLLAPYIPTPANRVNVSIPNPAMEIFSDPWGVSIYFPYSENFGSNFTPDYFDHLNTLPDVDNDVPYYHPATIVPADRDADSAPASEPYICNAGVGVFRVCFRPVTVNDGYAESKETHIVGVGAEPTGRITEDPPPPPPGPVINRVYHGTSKLTHQLDKFISFTGNGGGSEIKICRVSGYLQLQNQQVTNFSGDVSTAYYTRKDIHHQHWHRIFALWDPDWKEGDLEQVYAAYEEDTQGSKTLTGSLNTTLTLSQGNTIGGSIGYSIAVQTQDELVTQKKMDRYSFFRDGMNNQGWDFMADDNDFLPPGQDWPIYDGGTIWPFTWPWKTY